MHLCAQYAKAKSLLNSPRWKRFKHIAHRQGKQFLEINKAKVRHYQQKPKFKYEVEVPRAFQDVMRLGKEYGNNL